MVHTTDHTQLRLPVRLQQSARWERPALRPLPSYSAPSDARWVGDLGPSRALGPKRKRSRLRAPRPRPSRAAGGSRRQRDIVIRSPLRSPRRPSARNGRWIKPAKGFSKGSASAGRHGDKELEQERAPDGPPRGAQSRRWQQGEELGREGGAGVARTSLEIAPHCPW